MELQKVNHYTPEEVAIDCLKLIPYTNEDILLDCGSGRKKVWYNNFKCNKKYEYEIEEGRDFLNHLIPVDWVVGNPPYHNSWSMLEHAMKISMVGIGFLLSSNTLNSLLLPSRMSKGDYKNFGITKIKVMNIQKWFGRYFFVIWKRDEKGFVDCEPKTYKEIQ
jgi:hypothetical protein